MKAVGLTVILVLALIAGITFVNTPVLFLLTVLILAILGCAIAYEPSRKTEAFYAKQYREARERRMRELHLNPKFSDRYDVFTDGRPE